MLSAQELNVFGAVNFSVETNVLDLETLVIVAMTILLINKAGIMSVARNPTQPVKKTVMEAFNVKDKNCPPGVTNVMDLVAKVQNMD